jgi:hypothetical protein
LSFRAAFASLNLNNYTVIGIKACEWSPEPQLWLTLSQLLKLRIVNRALNLNFVNLSRSIVEVKAANRALNLNFANSLAQLLRLRLANGALN